MGLFSGKPKVITEEKKVDELLSRAVENVIPRELAKKKLVSGEPLRLYFGVDPTGAKLHLGHSVVLRKLQAFAEAGHHVIFLIGSFTAMIGDPSGRDAMREPLTREQVRENFRDYKRQAEKILDFSKIEIRYNDEWLAPLSFSEIVKLAGTFTVQQMLKRDMFEKRMQEGKPIGLHEFLYPLMVGYDSVVLDVDAELGGSDQEFNMLAGRHLQTALGKRDKFVLTTRLIEGIDGRKMSKTYNNCIYLDDEAADMYGKVMAVADTLVKTYLECATGIPLEEVAQIEKMHPKDAKMRLAREIVALYHGAHAARVAEDNWVAAFSEGGIPADIQTTTVATNTGLFEILKQENLVPSRSEFVRLIEQSAIRNMTADTVVREASLVVDQEMVVRVGKHRFLKIIVQ